MGTRNRKQLVLKWHEGWFTSDMHRTQVVMGNARCAISSCAQHLWAEERLHNLIVGFFLCGWGCFRAGLHKSGDNSLPALGIFKWVSLLMIRRRPGFTAELMLGCVSCWGVELLGACCEHIQSRKAAKINASMRWSYANPVRKCWHLIWGKFVI